MPFSTLAPSDIQDVLRPLASADVREARPAEHGERDAAAVGVRPQALGAQALELLYRRHHRLVFRIALRYGRGDVSWAEDITQDVFIDLHKALPALAAIDEIEGWLYRATTNRCFNRLRRERLRASAPLRWLLGEPEAAPRPPEALTIARDELRRAFDALNELPVKERVAFSMYYLDDKEQEEIGRLLGHSKGYVCKLIQKAVARLREAGWQVEHG